MVLSVFIFRGGPKLIKHKPTTFTHSSLKLCAPHVAIRVIFLEHRAAQKHQPPLLPGAQGRAFQWLRLVVPHVLTAGRLASHSGPHALCTSLPGTYLTLHLLPPKSTGSGTRLPEFKSLLFTSFVKRVTYPPGPATRARGVRRRHRNQRHPCVKAMIILQKPTCPSSVTP